MEFLIDLWIPILTATFALWVASTLAWMVMPHHFGDRRKVHCEDELMKFVKDQNISAGNYMFPYPETAAGMNKPEHMDKYKQGPRGTLNVYEMHAMPTNVGLTILYFLVTVSTIAYVTHVACQPTHASTDFMQVFRVAGTIGILTYASNNVLNRIWFRQRVWTDIVDGIAYGLLLGLIFAMLWKYPVA